MRFHHLVRATVYLPPDLHARVTAEARIQGHSFSTFARIAIEQALQQQTQKSDRALDYLAMGVNALLKYHPTENLLPIVQTTWKNREQRRDDSPGEQVDG